MGVSRSKAAPLPLYERTASTCERGWTARSRSREISGASLRSHPSQSLASSSDSIARIRSGRSGCGPVSCSRDAGWLK